MNRNTLDIAVPMVYAALVVLVWLVAQDTLATVVTVIGAIFVGLYFAAIRRNINPRS